MRLNILIGGKAGQGINAVSKIISHVLVREGYFSFNYRDYGSLIRGGHNFNVISISDEKVGSIESKLDGILSLDDKTLEIHNKNLKKNNFVVKFSDFKKDLGRNLNIAMAGSLVRILGFGKKLLIEEIKEHFNNPDAIKAGEIGYGNGKEMFKLGKLGNKINIMSGSEAISSGFINSKGDFYFAYPMTPATGVLHELGLRQDGKHRVFLPENEIAVVNMALGCSFTGKKVMVGTSGGGFDLMSEALSFSGMAEIPLVVYLASRPGPGTGVPTYTSQSDLNVALRAGHGEFPRIVIAPGDPIECVEKVNEALYLAEKFKALSIILSDKHLAESEFSSDRKPNKILDVKANRDLPGQKIVRASGYEHDEKGHTTEDQEIARKNAEKRLEKYEKIKKEVKKFQMIKIYGNEKARNLVIGFGSTKTVILDALDAIDNSISKGGKWKFLQVLYLMPLSDEIKKEIEKANNVVIVENNATGQLGRLIREKTGIKIENRILKYDSRPFTYDELKKELLRVK